MSNNTCLVEIWGGYPWLSSIGHIHLVLTSVLSLLWMVVFIGVFH